MSKSEEQRQIILYMHAGSGNHGCEAIANSMAHMLPGKPLLITNSALEDNRYTLGSLCDLRQERSFGGHKAAHMAYYLWRLVTKDAESFIRYRYQGIFGRNPYPLAVSIGGDNYCYENMLNDLRLANGAFCRQGTATVLLGCSIEPAMLDREDIRRDLSGYRLILARESITYDALCAAFPDREKGPEIRLIPDPAFTLAQKRLPLPEGFAEGNTVGVNISPMIQENESGEGITMANYKALLSHIIETTNMQIALLPHVIWERSDDRKPLAALYEAFRDTGRVVLIGDGSCEELKGTIARCRLFIGARTHATIAAYSSLVPTLVVGYSVKALGIAKDLFGTSDNYVIPVQSLSRKEELIHAFEWLRREEAVIGKRLSECMPSYRERALEAGKEVEKLWEECNMQRRI